MRANSQFDFENHPFLAYSTEIAALFEPLKKFFGLTSLVYQKNFLDGGELRLSNQPAWVSHFYQQRLYEQSLFEHAPQKYRKGHVLWVSLPQHQHILHQAREFNIDHGITLLQPQPDGVEFLFLGTTRDRHQVSSRYLGNLDLLEKFFAYFKEKGAPLLKQARKHTIYIPEKYHRNTAPAGPEIFPEINREAFLQTMLPDSLVKFSKREMGCVRLLMQGYNFKMIGQTLGISPRTVETHMQHIKQKTGCHTKAELIKYLNN